MFSVNIISIKGYAQHEEKFARAALSKFERAMNSKELKDSVINYTCPLGKVFESNAGFSNESIYEILYASVEVYHDEIDNTADLYLELVQKKKPYPSFLKTPPEIGYGDHKEKEIYTYSWWLNQAKDWEYAGHIAHELSHKLGFDHDPKPTPTRIHSVPYAFQHIIETICKTY